MLDKTLIHQVAEQALSGTDCYVVQVSVTPSNQVTVEIDSDTLVDIDRCADLTRAIEAHFDREAEDYDLEVGSAGLTAPLRLRRQFQKYLDKSIEVLTDDGRKLTGTLTSLDPEGPGFTMQTMQKVKHPDAKRPVIEAVDHHLQADRCKYVRYHIDFK